ncbi:hypothetical protein FV228_11065 [Methylobacterium sp. WL18]|uniref:hypothetical protein n=1 Tax=Methylobacterium sp. WL18 TaxID=2603897 RepID=UPI0011C86F10|nr:hypothetical protein [Methylobacterium sp. WL18]TXN71527.1 hypothetical protein FV228_11065 [Methylobacterium sp. WL18]
MNMYSNIAVHNYDTLPRDFLAEHKNFIASNKRGFGYWIWKSKIILDKLKSLLPHEILVYADIGFRHNPNGRDRMIEYARIAQASKYGVLAFQHPFVEYYWTKMDLAHRLNVANDLRIMATSQFASGLLVLVKNDHALSLVEEWQKISVEHDYHFINDAKSISANDLRFMEHRHDQSILSLLVKIRGAEVTFYETSLHKVAYELHGHQWPMLADRLRS